MEGLDLKLLRQQWAWPQGAAEAQVAVEWVFCSVVLKLSWKCTDSALAVLCGTLFRNQVELLGVIATFPWPSCVEAAVEPPPRSQGPGSSRDQNACPRGVSRLAPVLPGVSSGHETLC